MGHPPLRQPAETKNRTPRGPAEGEDGEESREEQEHRAEGDLGAEDVARVEPGASQERAEESPAPSIKATPSPARAKARTG